jgi:hypothetical protein
MKKNSNYLPGTLDKRSTGLGGFYMVARSFARCDKKELGLTVWSYSLLLTLFDYMGEDNIVRNRERPFLAEKSMMSLSQLNKEVKSLEDLGLIQVFSKRISAMRSGCNLYLLNGFFLYCRLLCRDIPKLEKADLELALKGIISKNKKIPIQEVQLPDFEKLSKDPVEVENDRIEAEMNSSDEFGLIGVFTSYEFGQLIQPLIPLVASWTASYSKGDLPSAQEIKTQLDIAVKDKAQFLKKELRENFITSPTYYIGEYQKVAMEKN